MGGIKLCRNRLGCFMKTRIYCDKNYVGQCYKLLPYMLDCDWPCFNLCEDPDEVVGEI